ncbi:MAG: LacI family transcriptional regulator, partial [Rhodoferax sp.]|nr:LacI family transcriptional regulator [Rhodoferax sp.]
TVLLDREIDDPGCDLVETAHMDGGLLAVRHLLSLGHRRIACIGGPDYVTAGEQRIQGWRMALAESGAASEANELLWRGGFTSQGGYEAMHAILRLDAGGEGDGREGGEGGDTSAPRPSAVFVCNDLMAIGALRAIHECGLRVPDDISIVGFDDIELSAYTSPPLTTVAQPKDRIGALAVDMLLERVTGRRLATRKVVLQPELRVRASTARPARRQGIAATSSAVAPSTANVTSLPFDEPSIFS